MHRWCSPALLGVAPASNLFFASQQSPVADGSFTLFRSRLVSRRRHFEPLLLYGAARAFLCACFPGPPPGWRYSPTAPGSGYPEELAEVLSISWAGGLVSIVTAENSASCWAAIVRRRLLLLAGLELWRELLAYLVSSSLLVGFGKAITARRSRQGA